MKPSAYTISIELPKNGILLLYNTRSGALVEFPPARREAGEARGEPFAGTRRRRGGAGEQAARSVIWITRKM